MGKVVHTRGVARAPFEKMIKDMARLETRVGFFESAKYPNGTPIAYVATIMEHGWAAGNIPPRPFMSPTIEREQSNWRVLMGKGANAVASGKRSLQEVMTGLGLQASGDVRKTISQVTTPALKKATILARARKYSKGDVTASIGKPLNDTGAMLAHTTYTVTGKSKS